MGWEGLMALTPYHAPSAFSLSVCEARKGRGGGERDNAKPTAVVDEGRKGYVL